MLNHSLSTVCPEIKLKHRVVLLINFNKPSWNFLCKSPELLKKRTAGEGHFAAVLKIWILAQRINSSMTSLSLWQINWKKLDVTTSGGDSIHLTYFTINSISYIYLRDHINLDISWVLCAVLCAFRNCSSVLKTILKSQSTCELFIGQGCLETSNIFKWK